VLLALLMSSLQQYLLLQLQLHLLLLWVWRQRLHVCWWRLVSACPCLHSSEAAHLPLLLLLRARPRLLHRLLAQLTPHQLLSAAAAAAT
jgi:hypothetical protein